MGFVFLVVGIVSLPVDCEPSTPTDTVAELVDDLAALRTNAEAIEHYTREAIDYAQTALQANRVEIDQYLADPAALDSLRERLTSDAQILRHIVGRVQGAYAGLRGESDYLNLPSALERGAISKRDEAQINERRGALIATGVEPDVAEVQVLRELYKQRLEDFLTKNEDNPEVAIYYSIQARSPALWARESTWNPLATTEDTFLYNHLSTDPEQNRERIREVLLRLRGNVNEMLGDLDGYRAQAGNWVPGEDVPQILTYQNIREALIAGATAADRPRLVAFDALVKEEMRRQYADEAWTRGVLQIGGTVVGIGALLFGQPEIAIPAFAVAGSASGFHSVRLYFRANDLQRRSESSLTGKGLASLEQSLSAQSEFESEAYWALVDGVDVAGGVVNGVRIVRRLTQVEVPTSTVVVTRPVVRPRIASVTLSSRAGWEEAATREAIENVLGVRPTWNGQSFRIDADRIPEDKLALFERAQKALARVSRADHKSDVWFQQAQQRAFLSELNHFDNVRGSLPRARQALVPDRFDELQAVYRLPDGSAAPGWQRIDNTESKFGPGTRRITYRNEQLQQSVLEIRDADTGELLGAEVIVARSADDTSAGVAFFSYSGGRLSNTFRISPNGADNPTGWGCMMCHGATDAATGRQVSSFVPFGTPTGGKQVLPHSTANTLTPSRNE